MAMNEPTPDPQAWDNWRIEDEMEKEWKRHGETYQYLWVRELCRRICHDQDATIEQLEADADVAETIIQQQSMILEQQLTIIQSLRAQLAAAQQQYEPVPDEIRKTIEWALIWTQVDSGSIRLHTTEMEHHVIMEDIRHALDWLEQQEAMPVPAAQPKQGEDDWAMRVKVIINDSTLAHAGYELAQLVSFALKTQHDEQFARDVDACLKSFWERCDRERQPKQGEE